MRSLSSLIEIAHDNNGSHLVLASRSLAHIAHTTLKEERQIQSWYKNKNNNFDMCTYSKLALKLYILSLSSAALYLVCEHRTPSNNDVESFMIKTRKIWIKSTKPIFDGGSVIFFSLYFFPVALEFLCVFMEYFNRHKIFLYYSFKHCAISHWRINL